MSKTLFTKKEAEEVSKAIEDQISVVAALEIMSIAASNRRDAGAMTIIAEVYPKACGIVARLEVEIEAKGWKRTMTSPGVMSLVEIGAGLHDSLEFDGAVGEGALPEKPVKSRKTKG